jgi:hypothetical protein
VVVALFVTSVTISASPAFASGEQAVIGMPFGGKWAWNANVNPPYTDSNSSHPSVHARYGADWATDVYAGAGTAVKLHATSPEGTVTFTSAGTTDTCSSYGANIAGHGIKLNVLVNGNQVGTVKYDHLDAISGGPYTNGMTLGVVTSESLNSSCYQVRHTHVEFTNSGSGHACYADYGNPGVTVSESAALGVLGSSNSGVQQACSSVPSAPATPDTSTVPGNLVNNSPISLNGVWTSDGSPGMAYYTRNSDGGFSVAIQKQTSTGLVWQGVWWDQPGSTNVTYHNTVIIPADANGDGLMDLYYATATDWNANGFSVGLMQNNGSGFVWAGTKWSPNNISLAMTKFIPGDWTGSGRQGFAYVTKRSDGGFGVAVFAPSAGAATLDWQGSWWDQPASGGPTFDNTKFIPADANGDGKMDLYYAVSSNWNANGFSVALMQNSGSDFVWAGSRWEPNNISLALTRFIPGDWTGSGREGFAYVTKRSDGGFGVAVFAPSAGAATLDWQGSWWDQPSATGLTYENTQMTPVDRNGDGRMDLYYTTSSNYYNPGFAVGAQDNTGSSLQWGGTQWTESNLALNWLHLLPSM